MAGRLSSNTRSGILAEKLGVLLLQEVSAVATVIEVDDYGVDAICTLLHPREKWTRAAAATFFTQIKTVSVKSVEYKDHEIDWFIGQELPFFIGRVDRAAASIQLFTCIRPYEHLLSYGDISPLLKVDLVFERSEEDLKFGEPKIWLGPPVLEWTTHELGDEAFHLAAFNCLESWVELERRNALTRPLGYIALLDEWKSGEVVKPTRGSIFQTLGLPENRKRSLEQAAPSLQVLALDLLMTGTDDDVRWVFTLRDYVRKLGGEIDPGNLLEQSLDHLRWLGKAFRKPISG